MKEKIVRNTALPSSKRIPVKDPDRTWNSGGFFQGDNRIFLIIKQILIIEIPWIIQL
jgi:hypothetical protein